MELLLLLLADASRARALGRGLPMLESPPREKRALESRYGDMCPGSAKLWRGDPLGDGLASVP